MQAVIIKRKLSSEEKLEIEKLADSRKVEIYADPAFASDISAMTHPFEELSPESKRKINFRVFNDVIGFGERKVKGEAITDHLMFETASFWHYHKFRIYFAVRNIYYIISEVEPFLEKFSEISLYVNQPGLRSNYFPKKAVSVIQPGIKSKKSKFSALKYYSYLILKYLSHFSASRKIKSFDHLLIDHSERQTCLSRESLDIREDNYNLAYLFDRIDKDFLILREVKMPKLRTGEKFRLQQELLVNEHKHRMRIFSDPVIISGFLNNKVRRRLNKTINDLSRKYTLLRHENNDLTGQIITDLLESLHNTSKYYLLKYLSFKRFFTYTSLKSVTTIDENSPSIKTILDAAKSHGIKTIGIQHGTIHELHPAYIYTKKDIQRKIIPDHTLVWGSHWKEFLVNKGNYPAESIEITGQIRTDIIPVLKQRKLKHEFGKNKKIIVFASQPQRDEALRKRAAYDVFSSVKDMEDTLLIVKLHPAEKNDVQYYKSIAKEAGCNNFKIKSSIDLYYLISVSELLITCFSTVGAETAYFKKPLIILDHLEQDIQGYYREGIALRVTDKSELSRLISGILAGNVTGNKEKQEEYISKYAYRIDGMAGQRVRDFIKTF